MATRQTYKMSLAERRARTFSESFKIKKVRELEQGITRPCDIQKEYAVSYTSIARWRKKYGMKDKKKPKRIVVQTQSDTKQLIELKKRIAELERVVGQKQLLIDFKDKMIELAEEEYNIDIKKKYSAKRSSTSGKTEKD